MPRERLNFAFLNVGHFLDHLFMLIFATVAALRLATEWGMSYAELIPYATPGFIAFGIASIPAGWIADKWSREGMLIVFFVGIGASSIATALAESPTEIAVGLFAIGVFAAIYHPVGLAMVVHGRRKTGLPLAINGVFGNLGIAVAALLTGYLIDTGSWRSAFVVPGAVSIGLGLAYAVFVWTGRVRQVRTGAGRAAAQMAGAGSAPVDRATFVRVLSIIVIAAAVGGLLFQSTTFALPKVFDERLDRDRSVRHCGRRLRVPGVRGRGAGAARGGLSRRPPLGAHGLRVRGGAAGGVLRAHVPAHGRRRPGGLGRVHARGVRPDPDYRRARQQDHQERMAEPRLFHPLHRDLLCHGLHVAGHRRHPRELGLRCAVRGDGRRLDRHPHRRAHASAQRRDYRPTLPPPPERNGPYRRTLMPVPLSKSRAFAGSRSMPTAESIVASKSLSARTTTCSSFRRQVTMVSFPVISVE